MTLRKRLSDLVEESYFNPVTDKLEKIADDYAIEFAKFIANEDYDLDFWVNNADIKNLLEIFKKEKGL